MTSLREAPEMPTRTMAIVEEVNPLSLRKILPNKLEAAVAAITRIQPSVGQIRSFRHGPTVDVLEDPIESRHLVADRDLPDLDTALLSLASEPESGFVADHLNTVVAILDRESNNSSFVRRHVSIVAELVLGFKREGKDFLRRIENSLRRFLDGLGSFDGIAVLPCRNVELRVRFDAEGTADSVGDRLGFDFLD